METNDRVDAAVDTAEQDLARAMGEADRDLARFLESGDLGLSAQLGAVDQHLAAQATDRETAEQKSAADGTRPAPPALEADHPPLLSGAVPSSDQPFHKDESAQDSLMEARVAAEDKVVRMAQVIADNSEYVGTAAEGIGLSGVIPNGVELPAGQVTTAVEVVARTVEQELQQLKEKRESEAQQPYRS